MKRMLTCMLLAVPVTVFAQESESKRWTVDELAEKVQATIQRFDTVRLEAEYTQRRDSNALTGKEPVIVEGSGELLYRGDKDRWYLRDDGFTFRQGKSETFPRLTITGYDGSIHYSGDARSFKLAEEGFRTSARPKQLIWETMLTYDYLSRAFDRETARIAFVGRDDGREVVKFESSWGSESEPWRLTVSFDTSHSFLPIIQKLWYRGEPYATSQIEQLKPVPDSSQWYPQVVRTVFHRPALGIINEQYHIRDLRLPDAMSDADFKYEPPLGADVIDRRSNLAWHMDPWWDAMMPWMGSSLGWPRHSFQSLGEFRSYADEAINGRDATPIRAEHWVGGNPGGWDRKHRKFSVLYFCGDASRLIDPNPRWTTELGLLADRIEPIGGEVIGVATADTELTSLERSARELMIRFPFAIDEKSDGDYRGLTHIAYGLHHYYSVMVVDVEGKVHLVGDGEQGLVPTIRKVISKEDSEWLADQLSIDPHLQDGEADQIKAKWIEMRESVHGRGRISGRIGPDLDGQVELVPQFRMLLASNPGGYLVLRHDGGRRVAVPDEATGDYSFDNLPRGRYELRFTDGDGGKQLTTVLLGADDDTASHSFLRHD